MSIGNGLDIEYRILSSIQLLARSSVRFYRFTFIQFRFSCLVSDDNRACCRSEVIEVTLGDDRRQERLFKARLAAERDRSGFLFG